MFRMRDLNELDVPHLHEVGEELLTSPGDEADLASGGDDRDTDPLADLPRLDIVANGKRGFDEDEDEEEGDELDFDEFEDGEEDLEEADDDGDEDEFDDDDDDDLDDLDDDGDDDE